MASEPPTIARMCILSVRASPGYFPPRKMQVGERYQRWPLACLKNRKCVLPSRSWKSLSPSSLGSLHCLLHHQRLASGQKIKLSASETATTGSSHDLVPVG